MIKTTYLMWLILIIVLLFSACQKSTADSKNVLPSPTPTIFQSPSPTQTLQLNSPIRKIDFKNFKYPFVEYVGDFTLKNGEKPPVYGSDGIKEDDEILLNKIDYSDLTNDGIEEAIIFMSVISGGSSMPNIIYIYTVTKNQPKLLWGFMTGDRADGGLKEIYFNSGELIVELFGENKYIDKKWKSHIPEAKFRGACCPTLYTKTHFRWNGEKFLVAGTPEIIDIPDMNETK